MFHYSNACTNQLTLIAIIYFDNSRLSTKTGIRRYINSCKYPAKLISPTKLQLILEIAKFI